jgi:dihydrodipicolinate synthase/N-acetylneuraminate lyase
MKQGWRGIFAIAASPFDDRGELLYDELARHIDWIVRAGSHGVVWPVNYSEVTTLSHEERVRGARVAVEAVGGRVPIIIGVSGPGESAAADYARHAAEAGADGVIAILPMGFNVADDALVKGYYLATARAAELPVFIQNQGAPWPGLRAAAVVQLCREIEGVEYVKEEKPPQGRSCQEIMDLAGNDMRGVFSGAGGHWLVSEMRRGISGCMPGAVMPDICAQIWDLWHAGREEDARRLQNLLSAYQMRWRGMPDGARKHVLVRRGILSTAHMRNKGSTHLDAVDSAELDDAIGLLAPYFRV